MKTLTLTSLIITALAAAILTVACSDDNGSNSDAAARGGASTQPVTAALLDSLPDYAGATLVSEWLADGGSRQVRQYAVTQPPAQAADAVTRHYRDALVADGWQESNARAAVSAFTKDGRRILIGRVGPQMQDLPSDATLLDSTDPPAGAAFFYTLEAEE